MLELTPFLFAEVANCKGMRLDTLWLRGGFPDALLARSARRWQAWQKNHVRSFIERDVARHRLTLTAVEVRRPMTVIAHVHGGVRNASELGRSLGYCYHTIQNALDLLEGYFLARRLPPYPANLGKKTRQVAQNLCSGQRRPAPRAWDHKPGAAPELTGTGQRLRGAHV